MAKYYYNGVLLPKIPSYEGYPYSVIIKYTIVSDGSVQYLLRCTAKPVYAKEGIAGTGQYILSQVEEVQYYGTSFMPQYESQGWSTYNNLKDAATNIATIYNLESGSMEMIWSNYDIPLGSADSSEIYFSAREPVAYVPEMVEPTYYNGVLLPKVPEDDTKPNRYVFKVVQNGVTNYMYVCAAITGYIGPYSGSILGFYSGAAGTGSMYYDNPEDSGEWTFVQNASMTAGQMQLPIGDMGANGSYELIWSNVDVPNGAVDSTEIYMKASDPVPETPKMELLYLVPESKMKALAKSIRSKTGKTEDMDIDEMISEIGNISGGGSTVLSSKGVSF